MKQILKYPGSKYKSADWIIRQFPEHHSYLEPFFGSGAILFNKERSDIETINDLDGEVINLFRQIKEAPQAIAEGPVVISGYDSEMYNDILQNWRKETKTSYAMSAKKRTEVIWCNRPEPWQQATMF